MSKKSETMTPAPADAPTSKIEAPPEPIKEPETPPKIEPKIETPAPPPPPRVPRSPRRQLRAQAPPGPAAPPAPEPAKKTRELPEDPAARAAALATVAGEAEMVLAILDVAAQRLPPARPLSKEERAAIDLPLRQVIWKYALAIGPEWALATALGSIAFMRYIEVKARAAGVDLTVINGGAPPPGAA